jgi:hypothetical protein
MYQIKIMTAQKSFSGGCEQGLEVIFVPAVFISDNTLLSVSKGALRA